MKRRHNILLVGILCLFVMLFSVSYIRAACNSCWAVHDDCGFSCKKVGSEWRETTSTTQYRQCESEESEKECTYQGATECAEGNTSDDEDCSHLTGGFWLYAGGGEGDACD